MKTRIQPRFRRKSIRTLALISTISLGLGATVLSTPQAHAVNPVLLSSYSPFLDYDWLFNYIAFYLGLAGTYNLLFWWVQSPAGAQFLTQNPALSFMNAGLR
ncbi:MAG: hypothetical protein Q3962_04855 [Corynebacterium sp.]|nr:hypothetical protein [Corynebacterium sp.]